MGGKEAHAWTRLRSVSCCIEDPVSFASEAVPMLSVSSS